VHREPLRRRLKANFFSAFESIEHYLESRMTT